MFFKCQEDWCLLETVPNHMRLSPSRSDGCGLNHLRLLTFPALMRTKCQLFLASPPVVLAFQRHWTWWRHTWGSGQILLQNNLCQTSSRISIWKPRCSFKQSFTSCTDNSEMSVRMLSSSSDSDSCAVKRENLAVIGINGKVLFLSWFVWQQTMPDPMLWKNMVPAFFNGQNEISLNPHNPSWTSWNHDIHWVNAPSSPHLEIRASQGLFFSNPFGDLPGFQGGAEAISTLHLIFFIYIYIYLYIYIYICCSCWRKC